MSDKEKTIRQKYQEYKEPEFGSFKWLSCHAGYEKIKELVNNDDDFKNALSDLVFGSIRQFLNDKP